MRDIIEKIIIDVINFESLKIKEIFVSISEIIKQNKNWDVEKSWELISKILTTPLK